MLEWPPLAVTQANSQKFLGQSDLFHKAATDPPSLTCPEYLLIKNGFHILDLIDQTKYERNRWQWMLIQPDLQAKRERALAAVLSPTESKVLQNLEDVFYFIQKAHNKAREENRRHERPRHLPQEWMQNVVDQREDKSWGYVWYRRKGQEGWKDFQHQYKDVLTTQMFPVVGWNEIKDSNAAEFVEFEARDSEEREPASLRE